MPSAGSAFRRGGSGAGRTVDAPVDRRWHKVEAFAVTAATMICALAIGLTVVTPISSRRTTVGAVRGTRR